MEFRERERLRRIHVRSHEHVNAETHRQSEWCREPDSSTEYCSCSLPPSARVALYIRRPFYSTCHVDAENPCFTTFASYAHHPSSTYPAVIERALRFRAVSTVLRPRHCFTLCDLIVCTPGIRLDRVPQNHLLIAINPPF